MVIRDKITDISCTLLNEFSKRFDAEAAKGELISSGDIRHRHREASLSDSEIMTILSVCVLQANVLPETLRRLLIFLQTATKHAL